MKLLARFEIEDPFGNKKLLKAFDDQGAVALRLMGIGESPESLVNLSAVRAAPAFWDNDPRITVGALFRWLTDSTPYTVGIYETHPDVEKDEEAA